MVFLSGSELFDADFDFFRLRFFGFRQGYGQKAIFVRGGDLACVDAGGERDAAAEFAGEPLGAFRFFAFAEDAFALARDLWRSCMQDVDINRIKK